MTSCRALYLSCGGLDCCTFADIPLPGHAAISDVLILSACCDVQRAHVHASANTRRWPPHVFSVRRRMFACHLINPAAWLACLSLISACLALHCHEQGQWGWMVGLRLLMKKNMRKINRVPNTHTHKWLWRHSQSMNTYCHFNMSFFCKVWNVCNGNFSDQCCHAVFFLTKPRKKTYMFFFNHW